MISGFYATYQTSSDRELGRFEFSSCPPEDWSEIDKARATHHFGQFQLAKRYSFKAAVELSDTLAPLIHNRLASMADLIEVNLKPVISDAPFANYWKKVMYEAMVEEYEGTY